MMIISLIYWVWMIVMTNQLNPILRNQNQPQTISSIQITIIHKISSTNYLSASQAPTYLETLQNSLSSNNNLKVNQFKYKISTKPSPNPKSNRKNLRRIKWTNTTWLTISSRNSSNNSISKCTIRLNNPNNSNSSSLSFSSKIQPKISNPSPTSSKKGPISTLLPLPKRTISSQISTI